MLAATTPCTMTMVSRSTTVSASHITNATNAILQARDTMFPVSTIEHTTIDGKEDRMVVVYNSVWEVTPTPLPSTTVSASHITNAANAALQARDTMFPISTIEHTTIDGKDDRLVLYLTKWDVTPPPPPSSTPPPPPSSTAPQISLQDLLSGLNSQASIQSLSQSSAFAAAISDDVLSKATQQPATTLQTSVRRVAPELVPTRTSTSTTETPTHDGSVTVSVSNGGGATNPILIVGIVLGLILGLAIIAALTFLLLRRRRRRRHDRSISSRRSLFPMHVVPHPPLPPPEYFAHKADREFFAPKDLSHRDEGQQLPDPDYFAPKNLDLQQAPPAPLRPRMSGETFTEEHRVGRDGYLDVKL